MACTDHPMTHMYLKPLSSYARLHCQERAGGKWLAQDGDKYGSEG